MTKVTAWRTDEPCPVCASGLIMLHDGSAPPRYECRLCGWSDSWDSADPDARDTDHLGLGVADD
jgi:ribosomal protein S27AE